MGLVGAGPWARFVHAPVLGVGPETTLAGVWARRPEAAAELAAAHGTSSFSSFDALLDGSDAVAFAVPPAVQAALAPRAAAAGKPLLLEKPLAADVPGAERVAAAVSDAEVPTLLVLTYRFQPAVTAWLAAARAAAPVAGRAWFVSGGFLGGPFATPWRREHGALLDLGPHVLDLLEGALGPIVRVRAAGGDVHGVVSVLVEHESGAVSDLVVSGAVPGPSQTGIEVYGPAGTSSLDARVTARDDGELRRRFAAVAAGEPTSLDAAHGLHLQRLVAEAEAALGR